MLTFYQYAPKLTSNPLYIYGISYGGVFAPTLAYAIHLHNQEVAMNLTQPHINLKGFIIANGATDYDTDPYISTWEIANAFDLIPNDFYKQYQEAGCRMYLNDMKVLDPEPCPSMFQWLKKRMTEFSIYDLRNPFILEINQL